MKQIHRMGQQISYSIAAVNTSTPAAKSVKVTAACTGFDYLTVKVLRRANGATNAASNDDIVIQCPVTLFVCAQTSVLGNPERLDGHRSKPASRMPYQ